MSTKKLVANIIPDNARIRSDQTAIIDGDRIFTFAEHYLRVQYLASALQLSDIHAGERLAILARNCAEYLDIYGVCEVFGFIAVPINYRLSVDEACYIVENTRPSILFYANEYSEIAMSIKEKHPDIHEFIQLEDKPAPTWSITFDEYIKARKEIEPTISLENTAPVYIVHTSGTTGKPKGAVLNQAAQYGTAKAISDDAGIKAEHTGLIVQPLFHVGAKFIQLSHHVVGATVILHKEFNSHSIWQTLEKHTVNTLQLVPTMIHMLLEERQDSYPDITELHCIFYSTAPIRQDLLRNAIKVFGDVFVQQYGSTESGLITSLGKHQHRPDGTEHEQSKLLSAGQAYDNVAIEIRDANNQVVRSNVIGEIVVKHEHMMSAYWNNIEATEAVLDNGWLHMGDVGYIDDDGFLFLVDRKKDMIISGGENIYPREVENALLLHNAVEEAAVIGIPDQRWGETVLAVVVLKQDANTSEEELIQHCKQHIASYKKPSAVKFQDTLPRVVTGKVDKVKLRAPYWSKQQSAIV